MSPTEDNINSDPTEVTTSDPFWFNNYTIIFERDRLTEFFPSHDMSYVEKLNAMAKDGKIKPVIDKIFPFFEAPQAHTYIQNRKNFGKVLLDFRGNEKKLDDISN